MTHWIPVRILAQLGGLVMIRLSGGYKVVGGMRKLMMRNDVFHTAMVIVSYIERSRGH